MDQQGENSMIEAGITGMDSTNPNDMSVVQSSNGNYRIMHISANGQQIEIRDPINMQHLQPVKHQNVMYADSQMQYHHQLHQVQSQSVECPNILVQDLNLGQQHIQVDDAAQQYLNSQLLTSKVYFISQNQPVMAQPIANVQQINNLQQIRGINVNQGTPPNYARSRGRMISLDGRIVTPGQKIVSSPPKLQLAQPTSNIQLPPNFKILHNVCQSSPASQPNHPHNMHNHIPPQLRPLQFPRAPAGSANGPKTIQTPPLKPLSQKTSLGAQKAPSQVINTGNKSYNIVSSACSKVAQIAGTSNENEFEDCPGPEKFQLHDNQEVPPQQNQMGSPKLPTMLSKPLVSTPPQRQAVSLPATPVTAKEIPVNNEANTPKYVQGKTAVCPFCGASSIDFNRCVRCKRKLPDNVKGVDDNMSTKNSETTPKKLTKLVYANAHSNHASSSSKQKPNEQKSQVRLSPLILKNKKPSNHSTQRKPKRIEEPVCLTISDDDDESPKEKPAPPPATVVEQPFAVKDMEISPSIKSKEPSMGEIQQAEEITSLTLGISNAEMEVYRKGLGATNIKCRTVRIGSYKVEPLDFVLFCPQGVRISLPQPGTKVGVVLEIPRSNITAVLAHLGRSMPVFFLYIKSATCQRIRALLNMKDSNKEPYFDSESPKETQKRITLLPERVSDEAKLVIKKIFSKEHGKDIMTLIEAKEANIILVKASPVNSDMILSPRQTRSQDMPKAIKVEVTRELLVYPKPPLKGGIAITTDDYLCLGEEQFLNDAIIDFYLKYLVNKLSEQDQARTHIFSSFFYRRLTTKQLTRKSEAPAEKLTVAEERHNRVKSWTKNVDIFEKDFIFIPINEHAHWYLAVICFPGLEGMVKLSDGQPISAESLKALRKSVAKITVQPSGSKSGVTQYIVGATTITGPQTLSPLTANLLKERGNRPVISLDDDEGSDRDEAEGDEDEFKYGSGDESEIDPVEPATSEAPKVSMQDNAVPISPTAIKQPCILIFDSLPANQRHRVVATLRDYLKIEYKAKKGIELNFDKNRIRGALPSVPKQNNFTDCGIFMLQYAESFFENPITDFHLPIKNLTKWFNEKTIIGKREEIAKLIQQLMADEKIDVKLPELTFAKYPANAVVVGVVAEPLPPLEPEAASTTPATPAPVEMDVPVEEMVESVEPEMVSLTVVVPDEHMLSPVMAQEGEIVISEEPSKAAVSEETTKSALEGKSGLNVSTECVDPENYSHCNELLNSLFGDHDQSAVEEAVQPDSGLKRSAETCGDEIEAKRVC